jgi:hypothetical protein
MEARIQKESKKFFILFFKAKNRVKTTTEVDCMSYLSFLFKGLADTRLTCDVNRKNSYPIKDLNNNSHPSTHPAPHIPSADLLTILDTF